MFPSCTPHVTFQLWSNEYSVPKAMTIFSAWRHLQKVHLQRGEQFRLALSHLQVKQLPLQEHLIGSLPPLKASAILIPQPRHSLLEKETPVASGYWLSRYPEEHHCPWIVVHLPRMIRRHLSYHHMSREPSRDISKVQQCLSGKSHSDSS